MMNSYVYHMSIICQLICLSYVDYLIIVMQYDLKKKKHPIHDDIIPLTIGWNGVEHFQSHKDGNTLVTHGDITSNRNGGNIWMTYVATSL